MGLYSVKNHNEYASGMADVWYSAAKDLWVEYKFIVLPKRADTLIDLIGGKNPSLSHLQQAWLRARDAEGRNVAVVVGCKEGGVLFSGVSWDSTWTTKDFTSWLVTRQELAKELLYCLGEV